MRKLLLVAFAIMLGGCTTLENIPVVGTIVEGIHEDYSALCNDGGNLASVSVAKIHLDASCDSVEHSHTEDTPN